MSHFDKITQNYIQESSAGCLGHTVGVSISSNLEILFEQL